ncbi:MAG: hypothetical protein AAF135_00900 [Bacteroidota bacterium]
MRLFFISSLLTFLLSCQPSEAQQQTENPPSTTIDTTQFAHVFQPWDGHWKGQFMVYGHEEGQVEGPVQPREISKATLDQMPLRENLRIDVEQHYVSTSPYYQTVAITDTYRDSNDSLRIVESSGYNQVTPEGMICVVNKPDEQVRHQGSVLQPGTITWERHLSHPVKVEYFYETATDSFYTIIGWGYYGSDDTTQAPQTWFFGQYAKQ